MQTTLIQLPNLAALDFDPAGGSGGNGGGGRS
jgi:hypothetical protein